MMKRKSTRALVMILCLSIFLGCNRPTNQSIEQSVYDSVIASGKLRAAYISYPPGCFVDPETGEVSGIYIDILREIGKNVGLEVEYTEEVGWGTMITGLDARRYDIMGSPVWANPVRGKLATLSTPAYFSGIGIWVRSDDDRFDSQNNWASINSPDVKIAAMDGSTPEVIARTQFPNAQMVTYPDLTGEPQLFLDVTSRKVDVFFAEPSQGLDFLKTNPGKIKNIAASDPVRIFANIFLMRKNEFQLKSMIDNALQDLQNSGFIDQVLRKYEPGPNAFYRVARPYQTPSSDFSQ